MYFYRCIDFVDIARRSSATGLQLYYTASRGFVSDSWAFLFSARQHMKSALYDIASPSDRPSHGDGSVNKKPSCC